MEPYFAKDSKCIEKVQHRATKTPYELRRFGYQARCHRLGLTFHLCRIRGDLIQQIKFENGIDDITWSSPMQKGIHTIIHREVVKNCAERYHFFGNRVSTHWNDHPDEVVSAANVNHFKNKLDASTKFALTQLKKYSYYNASFSVPCTSCIDQSPMELMMGSTYQLLRVVHHYY